MGRDVHAVKGVVRELANGILHRDKMWQVTCSPPEEAALGGQRLSVRHNIHYLSGPTERVMWDKIDKMTAFCILKFSGKTLIKQLHMIVLNVMKSYERV